MLLDPVAGHQGQHQGHRGQGRLLQGRRDDLHRGEYADGLHTPPGLQLQDAARHDRTGPPRDRIGAPTPSCRMRGRLQAVRRRAGAQRHRLRRATPARWSPWSATTAPASRPWSRSSPGSTPRTRATIDVRRQAGHASPAPPRRQHLGIATVFQDLALCDNLDVVATCSSAASSRTAGALDEVEMEQRVLASCCASCRAKIPSVRIPVASLSGGQRQTVAIARSLLGEPKVVMLDEPTAALGVAQTAEVLNLVERLRERGLGVILISHNMADVRPSPTGSPCCGSAATTASSTSARPATRRSSPRSPAPPTTPSRSGRHVGRRRSHREHRHRHRSSRARQPAPRSRRRRCPPTCRTSG